MNRFVLSALIAFFSLFLWSPWTLAGSESSQKTMMAAQTLQHLQMLIGQMQVIGNPIEQKKWANQVDTDLDQLKKEREELLAEAGPRSSIGWNVEYQNLVSDLGVLQANLQRWRPRTHWNVYWVDTKLVSSDLRGFDRLISRSLEEVSALQGSGAPILQ